MDEKTKLYVFSKKEVALIFLFMVVTAVTSFVVGVKMGKSFSYAEAGLKPEDRKMVDILSGQEEMVNEVVDKRENDEQNVSVKDVNQRLEEIQSSSHDLYFPMVDGDFSVHFYPE